MNKKNEIEAMAKVLYREYCGIDKCGKCLEEYHRAELLYNAGFGNVNKYKKEIERLRTELSHREEDLIHADENVSRREWNVALAEKEIKKQAVKEFVEKLKEETPYIDEISFSLIDTIFAKLYGAEEE